MQYNLQPKGANDFENHTSTGIQTLGAKPESWVVWPFGAWHPVAGRDASHEAA